MVHSRLNASGASAPSVVEFSSREGLRLGDKHFFMGVISEVTQIDLQALQGNPLSDFSEEQRLS